MINRNVSPSRHRLSADTQRRPSIPTLRTSPRILLLLAFVFTVMADPISSVAYAIEAALRALGGNLALLFPSMALVIVVIALVTLNYHQLVARFPDGGGSAAAAGAAFGEAWAFLPIGALVVDFVLTIAISVAAGASAIVAYVPEACSLARAGGARPARPCRRAHLVWSLRTHHLCGSDSGLCWHRDRAADQWVLPVPHAGAPV